MLRILQEIGTHNPMIRIEVRTLEGDDVIIHCVARGRYAVTMESRLQGRNDLIVSNIHIETHALTVDRGWILTQEVSDDLQNSCRIMINEIQRDSKEMHGYECRWGDRSLHFHQQHALYFTKERGNQRTCIIVYTTTPEDIEICRVRDMILENNRRGRYVGDEHQDRKFSY